MNLAKKYKAAMIAIAVILVLSVGIGTVLYFRLDRFDDSKMMVEVYFINPSTNTLVPERRYITRAENTVVVNRIFEIIYQAPLNKKLVRFPLEGVEIIDAQLTDMDERTVLELEFSSEYYNMSATNELFFRASLVWSLTGLDFISDVNIFVAGQKLVKNDGTAIGFMNRNNVVINPIISPDKIETQDIVLYFPDKELNYLFAVSRTVQVNPDLDIEKYIVQQLIAGSKRDGLTSSIPSETVIRSVKRDGDICYVNLSADFINKHTGGSAVQRFTVYSIVNSLTELRNVKKVQFLIEAEKVRDFKGGMDLSMPIERDESMISP